MTIEILKGYEFGDPRSFIPVNYDNLRHSAISWWIHQGATIKQVTARAGIASVATAFDRYGHILPNEDRDLARRLGQPVTPSI